MTEDTNSIQEILTVTGILSYCYVAQPGYKNKDGKISFKTSVILEKTSPDVQKIKDATRRIATAAWDVDAIQTLTKLQAQDKLALHDGDIQDEEYYKGKLFISCNAKKEVPIIVTLGNPPANVKLQPGHAFYPYSGCKAAVIFALYAQSPKRKPSDWGPRINCQLMGVQFLAHGTAFGGSGGRVATIAEFGINPLDADAAIPMTQADVGAAGGLF